MVRFGRISLHSLQKLYLPTGLLAALFCALQLPAPGIFLAAHHGVQLFIFIIFLVSGYQTDNRGVQLNKKLLQLFTVAALISLVLGPLLGVILVQLLHLTPAIAAGLIIMSTMPPTISSGIVITVISGGNALLALFLTISLNLLAILTIPFTLSLCLQAAGQITIDRKALLLTMVILVLAPFLLGRIIRKINKTKSASRLWNSVNSSCVILVVYASLAMTAKTLGRMGWEEYVLIAALAVFIHLFLFGVSFLSGIKLGLTNSDNKALCFVTSQKTLSVALAVIAGISIDTGSAIIACLIFHFLQIFTDSFFAARWQSRTTTSS